MLSFSGSTLTMYASVPSTIVVPVRLTEKFASERFDGMERFASAHSVAIAWQSTVSVFVRTRSALSESVAFGRAASVSAIADSIAAELLAANASAWLRAATHASVAFGDEFFAFHATFAASVFHARSTPNAGALTHATVPLVHTEIV